MAEISPLKRQREETHLREEEEEETLKRQKSFKHIISLLEEDEDHEANHDLTSLISTLQEELSSGPGPGPDPAHSGSYETDPENPSTAASSGSEEGEGERVMRHLLEASDDDLGLPNTDGVDGVPGSHVDGGDLLLPFGDGLWEFEDLEAANYYSLLQSDIFM